MEDRPERSIPEPEQEEQATPPEPVQAEATETPGAEGKPAAATEPAGQAPEEAPPVTAAEATPDTGKADAETKPTEAAQVAPTEATPTETAQAPTTDNSKPAEPAEAASETAQPATEASAPEKAEAPAEAEKAPAPKPSGPRLAELRPGMVLDGTVTRIERYGAFVNLGLVERRDGLIHISELSPYRVRRVEDVVKTGDAVRARVVSVDLQRGRVALSLNDVEEDSGNLEAVGAPSEPALTAMQLAFERAFGRQQQEAREQAYTHREDMGVKKRREQELLMRKFRRQ